VNEFEQTACIGGILFFAALARSTLGFGDALIAMPFLTLMVPMTSATPIVTMVSVFNAMIVLMTDWKHVQIRSAANLIVPACFGIPFGYWFLIGANENLVIGVLAGVVLIFSIWSLRSGTSLRIKSNLWCIPFGTAAGVLGGAYNTAGPPLVVFGTLRGWTPHEFRATLQGYFLVAGTFVLVVHSVGGTVTSQVLQYFAWSIPLIVLASILGRKIADRIPQEKFVKVVHVVLVIVGLNLLGAAFWN
jgi:uncharacterized membrane protein YfcA